MDGPCYSGPRQWDSAIRGVTEGNRWHFSENAHANASQFGARRPRLAQGSSGRPTQSGILAHSPWTHVDRPAAYALPMVGKAPARIAGEPPASHRWRTRVKAIGGISTRRCG